MSPKKDHDSSRGNEIIVTLIENPGTASSIGELSSSTHESRELVKGLVQTQIDAHLDYGPPLSDA
ncbi:MAG: hypothetical protein Q4D87_04535 [Actinomycetaceae bacterium]|nr:hypothetical protein [Actinomycetaceae bacterium]